MNDYMESMAPKQARAIRTRNAIVLAAKQAFSELGWHGTTAKHIASRAGVSVGSFYGYFPDKGAVLRHLAAIRFDAVRAGFDRHEADWRSQTLSPAALPPIFHTIVEEVIALHREDPGLHTVFSERRHVDTELDQLTTEMEHDVIGRLAGLLTVATEVPDPMATAFVCFSLVEGAVHTHVIGHPLLDDARLIDAIVPALLAITQAPGGHP